MGHIQIQNLHKAYLDRIQPVETSKDPLQTRKDNQVLDDINLDIQNGEMVCILGPSGCGKSTILKIIAGFESPSAGRVLIDNHPVQGPSSNHIFVFQHSGLLPWMTVKENVELGLRHLKEPERKNDRLMEAIEMVELEGFEDYYPHQLSGGMKRRAELARALVVNPDMLIMDEPFSGLDFLTHMKLREEVVNMHRFIGKTILIVTHDIDDALIMGDRLIVMSGRPAHVMLDQPLDFPHPRNFDTEPELKRLRSDMFLMLGVSYAV